MPTKWLQERTWNAPTKGLAWKCEHDCATETRQRMGGDVRSRVRGRIFIELMTSDRKLKAASEGSKLRIYGT